MAKYLFFTVGLASEPYMVVSADSLDAAIEVARQSPHIALGGRTIIRPCADPNM
jgi:hypothetical protein